MQNDDCSSGGQWPITKLVSLMQNDDCSSGGQWPITKLVSFMQNDDCSSGGQWPTTATIIVLVSYSFLDFYTITTTAFCALTLLVGRQEGHSACKN